MNAIIQKNVNLCLDFLKGIGCVLVICIHVMFPGMLGNVLAVLGGYVVPLFFMISGYYAYGTDTKVTGEKLKRKIKHITDITVKAFAVYLVFSLVKTVVDGEMSIVQWLRSIAEPSYIAKMLLMQNFDRIYGFHLWFLPALIYSYLFLYLINKWQCYKYAYSCVLPLFILRCAVAAVTDNWHFTGNFLLTGIPYILVGNYLASNRDKLREKLTERKVQFCLFAGCFGMLLGMYVSVLRVIQTAGTILFSTALFVFAQKKPEQYVSKTVVIIGQKYSLFIYIVHIMVYEIIKKAAMTFGFAEALWYQYTVTVAVFFITLCLAWIFYKKLRKCGGANSVG